MITAAITKHTTAAMTREISDIFRVYHEGKMNYG